MEEEDELPKEQATEENSGEESNESESKGESSSEDGSEEDGEDTSEDSGDEYEKGDDHVKVSEEFQQKVGELVAECENDEELSYIRTCVSKKDEEMRKDKMKSESKGSKTPANFSTANMPY